MFCEPIFVKQNQELDRSPDTEIPCMFCELVFDLPLERDVHMYIQHVNEPVSCSYFAVICSDCHEEFHCIHDKELHGCTHVGSYECCLCPEVFTNEEALITHRKAEHPIPFDSTS